MVGGTLSPATTVLPMTWQATLKPYKHQITLGEERKKEKGIPHQGPASGKSEFFLFCECLQFFLRELERASGSYNPAAF